MEKAGNAPFRFESLTDFHRVLGLPKPLHPLVSLVNLEDVRIRRDEVPDLLLLNFYKIGYKANLGGKAKYGQHYYDFGEGGMVFTAPNQLFEAPDGTVKSGYMLFIHPDFLLHYSLARKIKQYGFFSYAVNEALHLSDGEKETILSIFGIIENELRSRIDDFSHDVMIAQVELLLVYCERFYKRQFLTRKGVNHDLLQRLEKLLDDCFNEEKPATQGLPTVHFLAENLNVSPSYLSDMLRSLTGQNAQQHIHSRLLEKAKEKLSTTNLTVSEIAYELGFEHSQSFSTFFKKKTALSPLEFRRSFN